jgi:hypothetical protein
MKKPKVLFLKLTERMSAQGGLYLQGMCRVARMVGFKAAEPNDHSDLVWEIFLTKPELRPSKNGDRG